MPNSFAIENSIAVKFVGGPTSEESLGPYSSVGPTAQSMYLTYIMSDRSGKKSRPRFDQERLADLVRQRLHSNQNIEIMYSDLYKMDPNNEVAAVTNYKYEVDLFRVKNSASGLPELFLMPYDSLPGELQDLFSTQKPFRTTDEFAKWLLIQNHLSKQSVVTSFQDFVETHKLSNTIEKLWKQKDSVYDQVRLLPEYLALIKHKTNLAKNDNNISEEKCALIGEIGKKLEYSISVEDFTSACKTILANNQGTLRKARSISGSIKNCLSSCIPLFKPVRSQELAEALINKLEQISKAKHVPKN